MHCEGKAKSGCQIYVDLKKLWANQNMTTVKDFLIYYNLKNIDPLMEAVKNLQKFYRENRVDLFEDTILILGAARQMLFNTDKAKFALFNSKNEDLFRKIKIYAAVLQSFSRGICGRVKKMATKYVTNIWF